MPVSNNLGGQFVYSFESLNFKQIGTCRLEFHILPEILLYSKPSLFETGTCRKMLSVLGPKAQSEKCGMDHILDAQSKGEISEDNVLYIVENINVAGMYISLSLSLSLTVIASQCPLSKAPHGLCAVVVVCIQESDVPPPVHSHLLDIFMWTFSCSATAAIETTLWSIEWGVAELVNNPEIQKKIRAELDNALGKGNLISEPDTCNNKLPYLTAFVKEIMRLHMAIPLLVPHMNLHDAKLAGYDIPAESKILVNAWWIANNPKYWDQPEKFMPERFLNANIEANGNDFRFLPFGAGRRSCPGIIIAIPLLSIVLGRLVQSFELLPPPGVKQVDVTEKGGQFSLHIATHSTVVVRPIA